MNSGDAYKRVVRKVSMRLLPFMFVLYIISYLDRINVSFAGAPMSADLHFNEEIFGFGAGIFFFGYCLFGVPSNLALQFFGARKWIALIMVIWGFVSVLMAFVPNTPTFFVMRFLLGAAEAGFFPGMIFYLTKWFRKREHGMAVAKFMSAVPAAGILGGLIASQILGMPPLLSLQPWKWLFIITGSPAIIFGAIVLLYLPNGPEDAPWLSAEEKLLIAEGLQEDSMNAAPTLGSGKEGVEASEIAGEVAAGKEGGGAREIAGEVAAGKEGGGASEIAGGVTGEKEGGEAGELPGGEAGSLAWTLTNFRIWLLALLYFTLTFAMYGFQLWLPQIIAGTSHGDASETAFLTTIPAIFQAIGMLVIAKNSDRTGERRLHLSAAAVIAATGLSIAATQSNPVISVSAFCLTAFGIWGTVGPFWAMPTSFLTGTSAAAAIALINSFGNLGGFAGPYIVGLVKHQSPTFGASLFFMAGVLILGAVLSIIIPRPNVRDRSADVTRQ